MSTQVISTDLWEASLPEPWVRVDRDPQEVVYFESPDGTAGVYLSTWCVTGQSLLSALEGTQAIEWRNLPSPEHGQWEVLRRSESDHGVQIEAVTEYFNRADNYRIVSRLLGRDDHYVRLAYHDYSCTDARVSAEQSDPIVASLILRDEYRP